MSSNPNYNPQSNKLQGFTYGAGLKQPQYRQRPDRPDPISGKPGGAGADYWSELDNTSKNPKEVGEDAKEQVGDMLGKEPPARVKASEGTSDEGTYPDPPERPSSKNSAKDAQDITNARVRGTFHSKQ